MLRWLQRLNAGVQRGLDIAHAAAAILVVLALLAGSLWLTVDGTHLVRARAATVRPVSLYLGLGKVHSLEVALDAAPVGAMAPNVYLPTRLSVNTNLRVLFSNQHRRRTFTYSDFTPIVPPAGAPAPTGQAGRLPLP